MNLQTIGIRKEQTVNAITALARRKELGGPGAVSYTHLDVYKRQFQSFETHCAAIEQLFAHHGHQIPNHVVQDVYKRQVKKRKIGDVCRFGYDRAMPQDFLDFLVDAFRIQRDELVPGDKHLNLEENIFPSSIIIGTISIKSAV